MNYKEIEIHCLICKRDLLLAINNFKSLCKFEEFSQMPIYFHDDGSLNVDEKEILKNNVPNSTFIDRKWADAEIEKYLENHPNCKRYRLDGNHINLWHKIKSFDYFFFSKTKKVLGMDTDLLFLQKPQSVIDYINTDTPFYFPDIQSAYCFNEPKTEIPVVERVNTGLIYFPSPEYYNLDDLENALGNLTRNGINYFPSWIEQSAFAHMFYKNGKYKSLNVEKYRIPYFQPVDIKNTECLHFVSFPAVRETYDGYLRYLQFEEGKMFYTKRFTVEFENKNIPLVLTAHKNNDLIIFSYEWKLEEGGQHALDHHFKVETKNEVSSTHKFQSEKTGFFFASAKYKQIKISHTYDWYGNVDWKLLDIIET